MRGGGESVCVREGGVDGEWVLLVLQLFIPFRLRFGSVRGNIHSPFNHRHHFVPTFRDKDAVRLLDPGGELPPTHLFAKLSAFHLEKLPHLIRSMSSYMAP